MGDTMSWLPIDFEEAGLCVTAVMEICFYSKQLVALHLVESTAQDCVALETLERPAEAADSTLI